MHEFQKYESIRIDCGEQWIIAGDNLGNVHVVGATSLNIRQKIRGHHGAVLAIDISPQSKLVTSVAADRTIALYRWNPEVGELALVDRASVRGIQPDNLDYRLTDNRSGGHALQFNSTGDVIGTRSGSGALLLLNVRNERRLEVASCFQFDQKYDLICVTFDGESGRILSGYADGTVRLSHGPDIIQEWKLNTEQVHCIADVGDGSYLVSADDMIVSKITVGVAQPLARSSRFARDEIEQIDFNPVYGRTFVTSFDRSVYEIDHQSCDLISEVYRSKFKCRWIYSSRLDPDLVFLQTRDGGIEIFRLSSSKCIKRLRHTPGALWSMNVDRQGTLYFSGEGKAIYKCKLAKSCEANSLTWNEEIDFVDCLDGSSFTKRQCLEPSTGTLFFGRSDGQVIRLTGRSARVLHTFRSGIHDMDYRDGRLVIGTEDGTIAVIPNALDDNISVVERHFPLPVWAVAWHPFRDMLVAFEARGNVHFLNPVLEKMTEFSPACYRVKRAKWLDDENILYSDGLNIKCINYTTNDVSDLVKGPGNTIEDFIFDVDRCLIVAMCYTRTLELYDLTNGKHLSSTADQIGYSKGVAWLPQSARSALSGDTFITYGRGGHPYEFAILDERIVPLGPIGHETFPQSTDVNC